MKKSKNIKIHCSFDDLVPINSLRPHPRNPNIHTKQQIELLASIIKSTGWRYPVTVSKKTGYIVTGHCRYAAAKHLGLESVPVNYQSFKNNADELAELVRENKIREYAEIDGLRMADLLGELDQANYDLSLVAMTQEEISGYVAGLADLQAEDWADALEDTTSEADRNHFKITFILPNRYRKKMEANCEKYGKNKWLISVLKNNGKLSVKTSKKNNIRKRISRKTASAKIVK